MEVGKDMVDPTKFPSRKRKCPFVEPDEKLIIGEQTDEVFTLVVGKLKLTYDGGFLEAMEKTLFVQGLNEQALDDEVKDLFEPFGRVELVYLILSPTKQKTGCGFVVYSDTKVPAKVMIAYDGMYTMKGCKNPLSLRFANEEDFVEYNQPLSVSSQTHEEEEPLVINKNSMSSFQFNTGTRFADPANVALRHRKLLLECSMFKSLQPHEQIICLFKHTYKSPKTLTLNDELKKFIQEQTDKVSPYTSVAGKLKLTYGGRMIDLENYGAIGITTPTDTDKIYHMSSEALVILLVEKDDIYASLTSNEFYNRFPCIIIKGPKTRKADYATWSFLYNMKRQLNLPVLALVDCNPYSLKKLSVYGSGLYDIKWLGLRPSDIDKYKIPQCNTFPMNKRDIKVAKELLENEFVKNNSDWVTELKLMLKKKRKVECEALSYFSMNFLTKFYLPLKLRELLLKRHV